MGLACIECNTNGYNNKDENPNPIIAKVFVVRKLSRMLASDGMNPFQNILFILGAGFAVENSFYTI